MNREELDELRNAREVELVLRDGGFAGVARWAAESAARARAEGVEAGRAEAAAAAGLVEELANEVVKQSEGG